MTAQDRLTVLHVLEAAGHGTARHLLDVVRHTHGVDHVVVLPKDPTLRGQGPDDRLAPRLGRLRADVREVPLPRSPLDPGLVRGIATTRSIARTARADLLHGHATTGGLVARLVGRALGLPVVHTPHGLRPSRLAHRLERALGRWTDALVAVSDSEAALAHGLGVGAPDRIHVIPNGIDLRATVPPAPDLRRTLACEGAILVGWIGRLARQKAPDLLVEAMVHLPEAHAILVGGGPWRDRVARQVQASRLADRVHLLGHVPEVTGLLGQFDVLAVSSRWEGGPYVPLEAFRAGVPVVATDAVGTRDVVRDGVTGWLVPVEDPASLAAALRHATTDREEATRRTTRARVLLRERHDAVAMGQALGRLYREVVHRDGLPM